MKTNDFSYFIERYIANEMSDSEKLWFEKELDGNSELREEVNLRKRTDEILKNQDVISLRNKLSSIENQRKLKDKSLSNPYRIRYIRYAAVISVFVIIGSITLLFTGRSLNSETIMERYYKVYEPPTSQRSVSSGSNSEFNLALEFYNTHDYEKAAALFSKVLENRPNDMELVLLEGVSSFEIKKYPEAKQSFGKVIDDKNNLYIDQAEWYLALCYVNTNETEKAKSLFKLIVKEGGIYKDNASKILRGLK
jgi:tetratricopeptide (TPR) repeat protein